MCFELSRKDVRSILDPVNEVKKGLQNFADISSPIDTIAANESKV